MITLTEDYGKTWLPPVLAAEVPADVQFGHRSMKYSPKGDLGLIWKAMHEDKTFDLWSAVARWRALSRRFASAMQCRRITSSSAVTSSSAMIYRLSNSTTSICTQCGATTAPDSRALGSVEYR